MVTHSPSPHPPSQLHCVHCVSAGKQPPTMLVVWPLPHSCPPPPHCVPVLDSSGTPAEWRLRVHAARRRVLLQVRVMLLLKRGKKHVARLPRFDDLSFVTPQVGGWPGFW